MALGKDQTLPLSILGAGALVGIGLFFGLRRDPPPAVVPVGGAPSSPMVTSPAERGDVATPGRPAEPQPAAPLARVDPGLGVAVPGSKAADEAAEKAVAAYKKKVLLPKCWEPATAKQPTPAKAKYKLSLAFDGAGKEIGRGLSEDRSAARPDVADCIRALPMALELPGGVGPANTTVEFELP
jgi:hypothetical protein